MLLKSYHILFDQARNLKLAPSLKWVPTTTHKPFPLPQQQQQQQQQQQGA